MTRMHWLSAAAGALALGMFSVSAQAAPLGGATAGLKAAQGDNALTQQVRWGRHCWRHRGHWHCRRGHRRYHRYYYNDPYYYGPSLGLYFGSGHRHRGHHHRHHRRHR